MAATCHYDTLGISPTAGHKDIRSAFRQLAKTWHPDKNKSAHKHIAEEKFKEISSAFAVLGDASARRDYDARRVSGFRDSMFTSQRYEYKEDGSPPPPPPPPPRSNSAPEPWWKKQRREFQRRRREYSRPARSTADTPRHSVHIGNVTVSCGAADGCRVVRHSDGGVSISFGAPAKGRVSTDRRIGLNKSGVIAGTVQAEKSSPCEELRHACHWGKVNLLKRLLAHNLGLIRVVVEPKDGGMCLHIACSRGHEQCVRLLVCLGAELSGRDKEMKTPLHRASEAGHTNVVSYLLQMGADANAVDCFQQTAYTLANSWRYDGTARVLRASMK